MAIDLANYDIKAKEAVKTFWKTREQARQKQAQSGKSDQGERAGVTAGKNMDGFISLVKDIVCANGLGDADIHQERRVLTLPGYFRPTKLWDLLIINEGRLIAALELKVRSGRPLEIISIIERKNPLARRMIYGRLTVRVRSESRHAPLLVG